MKRRAPSRVDRDRSTAIAASAVGSWVPILCYHDIVPAAELPTATPYAMSLERFTTQMRLIHRLGFRTISVAEAARYVRERRPAPSNAIVLTFDDGYRSVVSRVLPVLEPLGLTGTAYLVVENLGRRNAWSDSSAPVDFLDDADVRVLQQAGWELGSHSRTHVALRGTLPPARRRDEIELTRGELAERFNDPIRTFCYPFNIFDQDVVEDVARAGYEGACAGQIVDHQARALSRITASSYTPPTLLLHCSRAHWRLRQSALLRSLKRLVCTRGRQA